MKDRVVLPGGGPACVHLLAELAQTGAGRRIERVTVLDPRSPSEGGTPHSDPSPAFRVNMRNSLHDIPGYLGFEAFLTAHGGAEWNPPLRGDLGRYTAFVAEEARRRLRAQGCEVVRVEAAAVAVHKRNDRYMVEDSLGGLTEGGRLVLATGHEPPPAPPDVVGSRGLSFYTGDSSFARKISPSDRVGVLGTGPGAIDVARFLIEEAGVEQPVTLHSRNGLLSAVQTEHGADEEVLREMERIVRELEGAGGAVALEEVAARFGGFLRSVDPAFDYEAIEREGSEGGGLALLSRDIEAARAGGPAWRLGLEAIGQYAPRIWRLIGPEQQARLLRHPAWMRLYYTKRHAMQMGTAVWLAERMREGRIEVLRAEAGGDGLRGYDRVVVATGPEYRASLTRNPLLRQMLSTGLARPCRSDDGFELGGLQTRDYQLADAPGIWAMGSLVRGEDFAVHAYPALARHARAIVAQWR